MEEAAIRFRVSVGEFSQDYEVPTQRRFYWRVGFVAGFLAAHGYSPEEIKVEIL
ncbi:hypothetical protein [Mycobacterium phage Azrael100]|nr:hypothetical protein [Mycobacterium phage Azrael100]